MIIGISGKIKSGKDTVAKIIQILTNSPHFTNDAVVRYLTRDLLGNQFEIKRFADTLKDCVCLFLGCSREQLEDRDFKEKELGEEWWYYKIIHNSETVIVNYQDAIYGDFPSKNTVYSDELDTLVKPTPRMLLQLMGTECGRNILHPNVWINALFSTYRLEPGKPYPSKEDFVYPNWVIPDMRFPNELKAVQDRGGITMRIRRPQTDHLAGDHPSETSLDNADFDIIINNDGNLDSLVQKVRNVLVNRKIID